ncbi:MAG: hypothetical protein HY313_04600 [Acidobacteria bacterium]|nr:hypothetical protein [Acidobacteriota bacterium]
MGVRIQILRDFVAICRTRFELEGLLRLLKPPDDQAQSSDPDSLLGGVSRIPTNTADPRKGNSRS